MSVGSGELEENSDERVYMIIGRDRDGDSHLVSTSDAMRAAHHYSRMNGIMVDVRGNDAFEALVRPNLAIYLELLTKGGATN